MSLPVDHVREDSVECVLQWPAHLGECPTWDARHRRLYWVDILNGCVHRFDPVSSVNETFTLPDIVPCLALRAKGGLLLGLRKCLAEFDPDLNHLRRYCEFETDLPDNRINDGACDPKGRFWVGTMNTRDWSRSSGGLYRFEPDATLRKVVSDVVCSNGTGWSPDGRTMYHTETFRHTIFAYDFEPETGEVSRPRAFVEVDKSVGDPDGLVVDQEGGIWSNVVGKGRIHHYDSRGKLERVIHLPVPQATASAFGGADLKTLYITSSRQNLTAQQLREQPLSGSLFVVQLNISGLLKPAYVG